MIGSSGVKVSDNVEQHFEIDIHTYILTYLHTYIHTYIHTHTHLPIYVHTYIHTYVHTYIRTYIHTRTRARTHLCAPVHTHIYIYSLMNFILNNQETVQTIYLYTVLVQGISATLTLIPLMWKIWLAPNNSGRWDLTRCLKG